MDEMICFNANNYYWTGSIKFSFYAIVKLDFFSFFALLSWRWDSNSEVEQLGLYRTFEWKASDLTYSHDTNETQQLTELSDF